MNKWNPLRNEEMDRLVDQLSPEARELWMEVERLAETPPEARAPNHRDKVMELVHQGAKMPEEDKLIWNQLSDLKQQALSDVVKREEKRAPMRWLANRMQEEGLRRGLNKEERKKATLGELFDLRDKDEEE